MLIGQNRAERIRQLSRQTNDSRSLSASNSKQHLKNVTFFWQLDFTIHRLHLIKQIDTKKISFIVSSCSKLTWEKVMYIKDKIIIKKGLVDVHLHTQYIFLSF